MAQRDDRPPIWFTRRAVYLHLTVAVVVPLFLGLFWWQVQRVREGNSLSWAYVFEWPFFTGYAVYLWWKLVHEQPATDDATSGATPGAPSTTGASEPVGRGADPPATPLTEEDEELAAYNRYLAELHATGRPKRWT